MEYRPEILQYAERGHPVAAKDLGFCYMFRRKVQFDEGEAFRWYSKSFELDQNAAACLNLGWCYSGGRGVEEDLTKAVQYYEMAAIKGNSTALFNLGLVYERRGDIPHSLRYFLKAKHAGHPEDGMLSGCVTRVSEKASALGLDPSELRRQLEAELESRMRQRAAESERVLKAEEARLLEERALAEAARSQAEDRLQEAVRRLRVPWERLERMRREGSDVVLAEFEGKPVVLRLLRGLTAEERADLVREMTVLRGAAGLPSLMPFVGLAETPEGAWGLVFERFAILVLTRFLADAGNILLPPTQLEFAVDLARALRALHADALEHGGVASSRCVVRSLPLPGGRTTRHCVLAGFGRQRLQRSPADLRMIAHFPPEVLQHAHFGKPADVYMLGVTIWEIFARQSPYGEVPPEQRKPLLAKLLQLVPAGLRPLLPENASAYSELMANVGLTQKLTPPDVPEPVRSLLLQCWSHDIDKRPNIEEVLQRLEKMKL